LLLGFLRGDTFLFRPFGGHAHVLKLIAADVEAAARRYGHHRNECSYCKHGLTDKFSRFYGIGPKCARDRGLPFSFASYAKRADAAGPAAAAAAEAEVTAWLMEDEEVEAQRIEAESEAKAYDDRQLAYEHEMELLEAAQS
jgi:hypothetical protein